MLAVLENKQPSLEVEVFIAARALCASERLNTRDDHILTVLVGGAITILKNMSSSMGRIIPYMTWKIIQKFQTTNQYRSIGQVFPHLPGEGC